MGNCLKGKEENNAEEVKKQANNDKSIAYQTQDGNKNKDPSGHHETKVEEFKKPFKKRSDKSDGLEMDDDRDEFEKQIEAFIEPSASIKKLLKNHRLHEMPHRPGSKYGMVLRNKPGENFRYFGEVIDSKKSGMGVDYDLMAKTMIAGHFLNNFPDGKVQVYSEIEGYKEVEFANGKPLV